MNKKIIEEVKEIFDLLRQTHTDKIAIELTKATVSLMIVEKLENLWDRGLKVWRAS